VSTSPDTGAGRLIEWTGERCVPWVEDSAIVYEHFHRYLWARHLVAGRRVLDLGSGEGFGAAILAGAATQVVGVDVDRRAVEHAALSYQHDSITFAQASALDLSAFAPGSFGAVVAFEMIEHVSDHERLMAEVDRVLAPEGLFIVSTPDALTYSAASGQVNEFHEHELTIAEFRALLGTRFEHVALWGQRTITGSYLSSLDETPAAAVGEDFFVGRSERGVELIDDPAPIFCVAVASTARLPDVAASSTLADFGLELVHETARAYAAAVAERDQLLSAAHEEHNRSNRMLDEKREEVLAIHAQLMAEREVAERSFRFERLVKESVTWQTIERGRRALYGTIGEDTALARLVQRVLRLVGKVTMRGSD
jgi:O-antigen biosynthesis protein